MTFPPGLFSWLSAVGDALVPSAELTAAALKSFFWGGAAAFLSISLPEGETFADNFLEQITSFWKAKIVYCSFGGIIAAMALLVTPDAKFLMLQSITVGATWPLVLRRWMERRNLNKFLGSGDAVKVKEKRPSKKNKKNPAAGADNNV